MHKDLLHKRRPPLEELFDRHTPEHHQLYQEQEMLIAKLAGALDRWAELA